MASTPRRTIDPAAKAIWCGAAGQDISAIMTNSSFFLSVFEFAPLEHGHCAAIGRVQWGSVTRGDIVQVINLQNKRIECKVCNMGVDAPYGQTKFVLDTPIDNDDFNWGWVISPPYSVLSYSIFTANVTFLTADEGGRFIKPRRFTKGDLYETITVIHEKTYRIYPSHLHQEEGPQIVTNGVPAPFRFVAPGRFVPLEVGLIFALHAGKRKEATCVVTQVIE
jgi:translation elongation factor EF-Tu-like GTPase